MSRTSSIAAALCTYAVVTAGAANATALFSADASFTMSLPGAVTNTFGFLRFGPTYSSGSGFTGNASASATQGTDTVSLLTPALQPAGGRLPGGAVFPDPTSTGVRVDVNGLSIDGEAAPDGRAVAASSANLKFNLGNLTGTPAPGTPPAQVIVVPVTGSYTFSQAAAAGGCTECLEHAEATFRFQARLGDALLLDVEEVVLADFSDPTVPFNFLLSLPGNSVTPLIFDISIEGFASSEAIIKNPEPASLAVLALSLAGLGLARRGRSSRERG